MQEKTEFTAQVIANAIDYIVAHHDAPPDLAFLAQRAGYETTYFQKLFKEKVGISPKRLQQYLTARHARDLLLKGHTLFDAAHDTGLSGTGRLHDLFVSIEGATPGEIKNRGAGISITYGFYPSAIGEILVAQTPRGVCYLGFLMEESRDIPVARMKAHFPAADFVVNDNAVAGSAGRIVNIWNGTESGKLKLDLHGTNMQIQVWRALLQIPCGKIATYKDIAEDIGKPAASRAVGNAVGANPVSLLIPCHRVIRGTGIIDNYGWGSPRKKLILALESESYSLHNC